MNKLVFASLLTAVSITFASSVALASESGEQKILKFGFAPGPYKEMVQKFFQKGLEKKGYKVEYVDFTDYVTPDSALESKDIDANLFQHQSYLTTIVKDQGLHLVSVINVPTLGVGVFSDKHKNLNELPNGGRIGIPTDAVNLARALRIASENGLIKLVAGRDEKSEIKASVADISENPKELEFVTIDAAQLPHSLDSLDAAIIPGNYAYAAKLDFGKALALEKIQENINNVIAVRVEDKDTLGADLRDVVRSPETKAALDSDPDFASFSRPAWWTAEKY